ncbi:MAG TPA: hypothetical protein DEP72_01080 [Clostridiales bacterium]|nr:hypothetical protein [Clostridiales bacterium]
MNYKNITKILLEEFPELLDKYREDDYSEDESYLVYEILFLEYIRKVFDSNNEAKKEQIANFIENALICGDDDVETLICITIFEGIVSERDVVEKMRRYLKSNSVKQLLKYEKFTGWVK